MHGTTDAFISKYSYLSSSSWNLYTEPLEGSFVEPNDEVLYETFIGSKYVLRDRTS